MARKTPIRHDPAVESFAGKLREIRRSRGMTQKDLARQAHVTESYLSRLESAQIAPGIDLVARLARAYGHAIDPISCYSTSSWPFWLKPWNDSTNGCALADRQRYRLQRRHDHHRNWRLHIHRLHPHRSAPTNGNYDFVAANGTLTINKAHLTVTADKHHLCPDVSYTGLVAGDGSEPLTEHSFTTLGFPAHCLLVRPNTAERRGAVERAHNIR
jgi:transcriptional regulator with XRE-family HTH domain